MQRLRTRLILAFLVATMVPLAATIWITTTLIDRSLSYAPTGELDSLSRTFEATVRRFYQRERDGLKQDALAAQVPATTHAVAAASTWPASVRAFWESAEPERFGLTGDGGDHLTYMRRTGEGVELFTRDLSGIRLDELSAELRQTRALVDSLADRDLRRGFALTLLLLVAIAWLVSLAPLVFIAQRISRPIQQLTAGLTDFAEGDWSRRVQPTRRVETTRTDEVGRAVDAFNHMAEQLRQNRDRLVHLTQVASWQSLARKTAHELKNSLTPIRLTVEEMLARQPADADRAFMEQAVQIVVGEIETLERRVRAFSDFSSEPSNRPEPLDINVLVSERVSLLKPAHPRTVFRLEVEEAGAHAFANADLTKGIVTNLLQNASEAAGAEGTVLAATRREGAIIVIEVHDSGPGLRADAVATLFEPTITFKKQGMGLGLSIAKRNALLCGGDLTLIEGMLGGAAFRVALPALNS